LEAGMKKDMIGQRRSRNKGPSQKIVIKDNSSTSTKNKKQHVSSKLEKLELESNEVFSKIQNLTSKYMYAHASIPLRFEKQAAIDASLPTTESALLNGNLTDTFVRAQVPIMEAFLEYFLECDFMVGLSITQSAKLMRKHILMIIIFQVVFQRNTDNTTSLNKVRMPRNYFHQVWGPSIAGKVAIFYDKWEDLLKRDWTLLALVNLYMVFDNEDSFYQSEDNFKSHCNKNLVTLRHYMHVHCMKEKKPEVFTDLWVLYSSIADVRNHVGTELIKFPKEASSYYPYMCEVINEWWKFSLDEQMNKLAI